MPPPRLSVPATRLGVLIASRTCRTWQVRHRANPVLALSGKRSCPVAQDTDVIAPAVGIGSGGGTTDVPTATTVSGSNVVDRACLAPGRAGSHGTLRDTNRRTWPTVQLRVHHQCLRAEGRSRNVAPWLSVQPCHAMAPRVAAACGSSDHRGRSDRVASDHQWNLRPVRPRACRPGIAGCTTPRPHIHGGGTAQRLCVPAK
jgi:hypothetical protein